MKRWPQFANQDQLYRPGLIHRRSEPYGRPMVNTGPGIASHMYQPESQRPCPVYEGNADLHRDSIASEQSSSGDGLVSRGLVSPLTPWTNSESSWNERLLHSPWPPAKHATSQSHDDAMPNFSMPYHQEWSWTEVNSVNSLTIYYCGQYEAVTFSMTAVLPLRENARKLRNDVDDMHIIRSLAWVQSLKMHTGRQVASRA